MANNSVIISRIQNRRGLKQDLPQPLRAGELGFAIDSRQVFIGADTDDSISASYNKTLTFENTTGAKDTLKSIANNQIISFTVPHIRYTKGEFDGQTKSVSYTPTTTKTYTLSDGTTNTRPVFPVTITDPYIVNIASNLYFKAEEITVVKNTVPLKGQNSPTIAGVPDSGYDYVLNANASTSNTHTLNFRVAPESTDSVGITYYGNSAVIQTLQGLESGIDDSIIYSGSGENVPNFYNRFQIPTFRQIPTKYIRIAGDTGRGYIGLQHKHIAVTADSTSSIDTASLNLGNLVVSRDSQVTNNANISAAGSTLTLTIPTGHLYNASSTFGYVYIENADSTDWINNKVLPISNVTANSLDVVMPSSNAWQTARAVVASEAVASVVTVTGNTSGLTAGDYVKFIGSSSSSFDDATPYQVSDVTSNTFKVTESNVTVAISSNLDYINYGSDNSGANVQLVSSSHGLPVNAPINLSSSSNTSEINNSTFSVLDPSTTTFFIGANSAVTSNITGTFATQLIASNVSHTPTRYIDLSSATTLNEAVAVVNGLSDDYAWMSLNINPENPAKVYFTHKESYSSVPLDFKLHEDADTTLTSLKLNSGSYDRSTTVKAKLELFLHDMIATSDSNVVNVYQSVSTNQKYNSSAVSLNAYTLDIDDTFDEMNFNSRGEASAFSYIVNHLYYERSTSAIKGLVNLKTNVELLTSSAASALNATSSYDTPLSATISSSGSSQSIATFDITGGSPAYDSFVVDYSVNYDGVSQNYRKLGTLYITGYNNTSSGNADVGCELDP